jgi:hypothetical protein
MAVREWGEQQPNGTVNVYQEIGGAPVLVRTETMAQNQGGGAAPAPAPSGGGGGGGGMVQTREGPRTMDQVRAGIKAANGNVTGDDATDLATFNNVDTSGGGGGGSGGSGGGGQGFNSAAAGLALQAAEAAAQREYLNTRLRLLEIPQMQQQGAAAIEALAQRAAEFAWQKVYQQGQLDIQRGSFDFDKWQGMAEMTGYLPDTGAAKRLVSAYEQGGRGAESWAATLGVGLPEAQRLYAAAQRWQQQPGNEGKQATDAVLGQLAMAEGLNIPALQGQSTFKREQYQTDTAMKYLMMANDLKKQNPFAYLATLQNTPNSIRNLVNTALQGMGVGGLQQAGAANPVQGIPGVQQEMAPYTGPPNPYGPRPATPIQGFVGPDGSSTQLQTGGPRPAPGPATPEPMRSPVGPRSGMPGNLVYEAQRSAQPMPQPSYQMPQSFADNRVIYPQQQAGLPGGNQINARDWLNTAPWLKTLALQGYEQNGQDPSQVMHDFQKSLPRAVGPSRGLVRAG